MKKLLDKKTTNALLAVLIAGAAGYAVWNLFDVGPRIKLSNAIGDLLDYREVPQARKALREIEDRGKVVSALKAAVDEDTDLVQGKLALLDTLAEWQEPRAARRALDSKSVSSQRAAVWKYHGDKSVRDQVKKITLDWIRDTSADARDLATIIVGKLKIKEALPLIEKGAKGTPETVDELQFAMKALDAMYDFKSPNLAKRALEIAADENQHTHFRAKAFDMIGRLKDKTSTDQIQAMMIKVLQGKDNNNILRNKAAGVLQSKRFANATVWGALEEVLLRKDDDGVVQRTCLYALGGTAPLDKIRTLLLDRRLYQHPYFGIRIDVCTGLAALSVPETLSLEIMCQLIEDRDKQDLNLMVPQEAWLSYWTLTGNIIGVPEPRLFKNPPRPFKDEVKIREYLWKPAQTRIGVTFPMVESVQRMVCSNYDEVMRSARRGGERPDRIRRTEDLKNVADSCRAEIAPTLTRLKQKREAEAEKNKKKDGEKKNVPEQGPTPDDEPKKDDGAKTDDGDAKKKDG